MKDKKLKFLGLGSVVEVNSMEALKDTKYFVIARAIGQNSEGDTILRYMLAPHPFGDIPNQQENILKVMDSEITKVIHEGYTDVLDEQFLEDLEQQMRDSLAQSNSSLASQAIQKKDTEQGTKQVLLQKKQEAKKLAEEKLNEQEMLKRDPFYKFIKMKEAKGNDRID